MNRAGVALAADSAVSIATSSGNTKIYNSNKLFMLSKYRPVGVMIYGNADLMSAPWETIIKLYRKDLGETPYKTLREYGESFVNFIKNSNALFPENDQTDHVYLTSFRVFSKVKKEIDSRIKQATLAGTPKISTSQIARIADETIERVKRVIETYPRLTLVPGGYERRILSHYYKVIQQAIDDCFRNYPFSSTRARKELRRIAATLFVRDLFEFRDGSGNRILPFSGVVVAGFGEDDLYPCLISYQMEGVADNVLKYKEDLEYKIGSGLSATLVPFAQKEMIYGFMDGATVEYRQVIKGALDELFDKYPQHVIKQLKGMSKKKRTDLLTHLKSDGADLLDKCWDAVNEWMKKNNSDPILDTIEVLPIAELASMAESLVNLTSFKRRVTLRVPETVGGPIDVAVITKGDGFIWINRKHYFEAKANPHFFQNYYR
ncbi:MAG TPA: hypothetical protein VJM12_09190 [Pyrinomonadaceae bacterium]|nr:hypothetical protein [Pyrinomonadaceae bacterium]